jgi:hypothetical protein
MRLASAVTLGAAALLLARRAAATDPFEIQVYDGTANEPGAPGVELHANRSERESHMTLEPSYGVLPWWELGGYLQSAVRPDGTFDYAGVKLRSKFVTPPGFHPHVRLGVNVESAWIPGRYDPNRWGGEIRPIAAFEDDAWLLVVNPILELAIDGPDASDGPAFEPALMAKRKITDLFALGVEYYASLGPLAKIAPVSEEEHYVYAAGDLLAIDRLELNVGAGFGLTDASRAFTLKAIFGWSWEPAAAPPRAGP